MRARVLLLLTLLLLGGCGGSSTSSDFISPGNGPLSRGAPRSGTVALARVVEKGVEVEAQTIDGQVVDKTTTGVGGRFHMDNVPARGRVVARFPDGLTLSADLDGQERRWLWIGPVTTMASRYRQLHPELSVAEADSKVARYLQIPAGVHLGSGLGNSHRSPFSWDIFRQEAGSTGLNAFLDQQAAAVDSGQTRSFKRPDPYRAIHALLDPSKRQVRLLREQIRAQFGEFAAAVGTNIFSNFLGGAIKSLGGWICEACGLNFGVSAQLTDIENQLDTIQTELDDVNNELVSLTATVNADFAATSADFSVAATQTAFTSAQQTLQAPANRITTQVKGLSSAIAAVQPLPTPINQPRSAPPAAITEFVNGSAGSGGLNAYAGGGTGQLFQDLATLRQVLQGLGTNPNIVYLYASALQNQLGNAGPTGPNLFADWRSNAILEKQQNLLDLYRSIQVLGLILVSEWSHLDGVTFPVPNSNPSNLVATNINQAIQTLRQMSADLVVEQQQVPPATIGGLSSPVDDVLVDVSGGVMWYTVMGFEQYYNEANLSNNPALPAMTAGIFLDSQAFSLGPWGAGIWRLPSLAEMERLQQLAITVGKGNPTKGLLAMGFNLGGDGNGNDIAFLCQGPPTAFGFDEIYGGAQVNGQQTYGAPPAAYFPGTGGGQGPIENFSLYLYDMTSGNAYTPALQAGGNGDFLQPGVAFNYFFVRSCPGLTSISGVDSDTGQVKGAVGEDTGTLAALPLGTVAAGPSPAQMVSTLTNYVSQVTPTDPFGPVGGLTNFNVSGFNPAYASSTLDVTPAVAWSSSNVTQVDVSNLSGQSGNITYHTATPSGVNITGSLITAVAANGQAVAPATAPTVAQATFSPSQMPNGGNPAAPALTSILVTPCNRLYSSAQGTPPVATDSYFATGFYSDNTVQDLTNQVSWSVTTQANGSGSAQFSAGVPNLLQVPQSVGTGTVSISASYQGITGLSQAGTSFFTGSTAPTVTKVEPLDVSPSRRVTVTGTNFTSSTTATIAGVNAPVFFSSSTQIQVTVPTLPTGTTGSVPMTITNGSGSVTANLNYSP